MKKSIFTLLIFLLGYSILANDIYKLVRVHLNQTQNIESLVALGFDMEGSTYKKDMFIEIVANPNNLKQLDDHNYDYEVIIDDLSHFYEERLIQRVGEGFGYGSMGGYYTFAEVVTQLDSMKILFPNLITSRFSIGASIENRDIWAVKISNNPDAQENEPEVLYTALHHAREPESMMVLLYYMWYLLENYGIDSEATYLVDNRQIWFVPVVNPDGYVYNQTTNPNGGGMWRKNRRNNGIDFGVDLNRNYGYNWGYDDWGSSPDPANPTYRGTAAFSEPETQAIKNFCNAHSFGNALNYHTYSNLLLMPWGYENLYTPDSSVFMDYAQIMTQFNGYEYGISGVILYNVNGDANDWMYGEQSTKSKILGMTPEVGNSSDGFWPPTNRILPLAVENLFPNKFYSHVAGGFINLMSFYFTNDYNGYQDPGETPDLIFEVKNIGLNTSEIFSVEMECNHPGITLLNPIVSFPALGVQNMANNSNSPVSVQINSNVAPGDRITLIYHVTVNGLQVNTDSLSFTVGTPNILFSDDGEQGTSNFQFDPQWGLTTSSAHSANHSFTDSPSGVYPNYYDASLISQTIDLQNTNAANLSYWTKWDIESDWDFATVEISVDNGISWQYLQTTNMSTGSGIGTQPSGIYGYDGTQSNWIKETIDISAYTGNLIKIRFHMTSDSYVQRDGWYVDDISIYNYPPVSPLGPQISISKDSMNFVLPRGMFISQDLVITNGGSESLHVTLSEELPVKKDMTKNKNTGNLFNSNKVPVISDPSGDTNDPTIDVVQVDVERVTLFGTVITSFDVTFASPPDSGTFGFISIDLDQEMGTGVFPAPFGANIPVYDIGSEIEIIFDVGGNFIDTLGFSSSAVALSAIDGSFIGFAPIQVQGNTASADFIYIPALGGAAFDESFNLAATFLSFDNLAYPDHAPDYGHGTFGTDIPISWLSALPQQFSLAPGDSMLMPVKFVSVNEPGNYAANLNFASNDTITPLKSVALNFTILGMLQPDIYLPVTVVYDTVKSTDDSSGTFIIENHGQGELIYFTGDSLPGNGNWLNLPLLPGIVPADSFSTLTYWVAADTMKPGKDYSGYINIASNDPDERFTSVLLNVHVRGASSITDNNFLPLTTELRQNYPNPFNPSTQIQYSLAKTAHVELVLYNLLGQKVIDLVNKQQIAGYYNVTWNGQNKEGKRVASGVYIYELKTEQNIFRKKMLLLR